ncbi:Mu transposase C-terminal domain-containing protein [Paenibacillus sp. TAF58]
MRVVSQQKPIEEFTEIILKCVLFHNKSHVLKDYILDELMLEEKVEKIPIEIWNHGLRHRKGQLRTLPEEMIKTHLFPTDTASVTSRGVSYKKMLYASEYTLKNEWFQKSRIKGSWKVKICYDPRDLTNIYVIDENNQGLQKLTLLDHLTKYANKGIEEIERMAEYEQSMDEKSKDRELQEKVKLFTEIEQIVKDAKRKTDSERDYSKSKSKRLAGIKENQRNERLLHRGNINKKISITEDTYPHAEELDELQLFRQLQNDDKENHE